MLKVYYKGYHWPHILFFSLTPIAAIAGLIWMIDRGGPSGATWILAGVMFILCGLGVTAGYHRLFSHKSYSASWPVRLFYIIFGGAAFEGSVRWWASGHRNHHRYTDTEKDPYGINKGFWYAHLGWLFTKDQEPPSYENVKDLDQDPFIRFQARFYPILAVLIGFLMPTAVASLWGDPWGGFLVAGLLRMVINHHATFCINSVCHYVGKQTYSDKSSARDSWVAALLTYGEGYHNFHHEFPQDYRNGIRSFHWDPTKWLIRFLGSIRLAWDLREARREKILQARLEMDQRRVAGRLSHYSEAALMKAQGMLAAACLHLQQAHARFIELREKCKTTSLDEIRLEYAQAKREFKIAMARWRNLIRGPIILDA